MLPLVYHEEYVTPLPEGHRFPMGKFALLRDVLVEEGFAPGSFCAPDSATREQLEAVHDPAYVEAFVGGKLTREQERVIGLPWSEGLVRRTIRAVGGTIKTAELAMASPASGGGLACNCAGGTHHAHRDFGSGFCIFNDLAVAAAHLVREHGVSQVLILDLDVHQGDGTARLFPAGSEFGDRVFTASMHCGKNFPSRKASSDLDVELPVGMGDAEYLEVLAEGSGQREGGSDGRALWRGVEGGWRGLLKLLEAVEPDVVLYDAGVDVHADDALGHLCLTDAGLYARDRFVIEMCRGQGIPTACVIGGGYDKDWRRLASRHASVHRAARDVLAGVAGVPGVPGVAGVAGGGSGGLYLRTANRVF